MTENNLEQDLNTLLRLLKEDLDVKKEWLYGNMESKEECERFINFIEDKINDFEEGIKRTLALNGSHPYMYKAIYPLFAKDGQYIQDKIKELLD